MTQVLRLELDGFKSFGDETVIPFGKSFNCILGPNGSGKSNIIDSICFVLGKMSAKGMRAEETANLIFNGGKQGSPAQKGRVSIYFDDSDDVFTDGGDELKVSRIVHQDGSSVYKMDDEETTRTNIQETLKKAKISPDGYNIILQGDISKIVEMSENERRKIVEEIAGIDIYEDKRKKAMRELDRVEEKLEEAKIVLQEREQRLNELEEDKKKAEEYQEVKNKLKRNKATKLNRRQTELEDQIQEINETIDELEEKKEEKEDVIEDHRETIATKQERVDEINEEVESRGEEEQVEIHQEIEELKVDVAKTKQTVDDLETKIEELDDEIASLEEEKESFGAETTTLIDKKESLQEQIEEKEQAIADVKEELDEYKAEHEIENTAEIDDEIESLDEDIDDIQGDIDELREEQQRLLREKDKKETRLETVNERIKKVEEAKEENEKDLERLKQKKKEYKQASVDLSKALNEDNELSSQQSNVRSKLYSKREKHAKLEAKTARIREKMSGSKAIQGVLDLGKKGVHGVLSELGQVEEDYAKALQIAAGSRAKSIVTETDDVAQDCIDYLKKNKLGYANFIPLNKIKARTIKPSLRNMSTSGVIGLAIDLIDYDKKYDKAFKYALGNTLVVQDIATAKKVGFGKARMITVDGDKVEKSGAMQGGHRRSKQALGFTQKETAEEMESLEKEIKDLEQTEQRLSEKRDALEDKIKRLRNLKNELEGDIVKLEKSLRIDADDADDSFEKRDELQDDIEEFEDKIFEVQQKISSKNKALAQKKQEKQKLRDKLNTARSDEVVAQITSYEQQIDEFEDERAELQRELDKVNIQEDEVLGPKMQEINEKLDALRSDKEEAEEKYHTKQDELEEKEERLADRKESQQEFYDQFKQLFDERKELTEEINTIEGKIVNRNQEIQDIDQKLSAQQMNEAKAKTKLQNVKDQLGEYEGVPVFEDKDDETIDEEIERAEELMDEMGAVNMRALEVYDEVNERYQELLDKKDRLEDEKESVLVMINEVDTKKKELFMETYEVINHNFKEIFQALTAKGKATLELEDEDDPLNHGMTMKVKLSGDKYMDIRALSGGEKTLTALSFIFAVQEHEPHAFYVLDEVDAALDQRNSDRLAELVKEYSDTSQYIMISHNDNVIQEADCLYGVSMNDARKSKITTLEM
jgi:chromosome segregation protein